MDRRTLQRRRIELGYPNVPVPAVRDWNKRLREYTPDRFVHPNSIKAMGDDARHPNYADPQYHRSYEKKTYTDEDTGHALNPRGRTGLVGIGALWHPGASFTADYALTRRNDKGAIEVVIGKRKDNGRFALPGGFVDPHEDPMTLQGRRKAAQREMFEETRIATQDLGEPQEIYKGATDSYRNTDEAWIETSLHHLHVPYAVGKLLVPRGNDDMAKAQWAPLFDLNPQMMNDSHAEYIQLLRRQSFA